MEAALHKVTNDRFKIEDQDEVHVLIVNLIEFENKNTEKRKGAERDEKVLKSFFETHLNCKRVQIENKANKSELLDSEQGLIAQLIKRCLNNCWLCVFVIMTHGMENDLLQMSDGGFVYTKQILNCFSESENARKIQNVPKVLLLVACRGSLKSQYEKALLNTLPSAIIPLPSSNLTHNPNSAVSRDIKMDDASSQEIKAENEKPTILLVGQPLLEYCTVYSTDEGYPSFRHKKNGSMFVRTFCKVLTKFYQYEHFLTMMTKVKKYMLFVAPVINLNTKKGGEPKLLQLRISCKTDSEFSEDLFLVSNPKSLIKIDQEGLDKEIKEFMVENFERVVPIVTSLCSDDANDETGGIPMQSFSEVLSKLELMQFDASEEQVDKCIFGRLLFKRAIYKKDEESPHKFSFVFRDESGELPIYSYEAPGAQLYYKLKVGTCYLIRNYSSRNAETFSPLGSKRILVVMKPEYIQEAQEPNGESLLQYIPKYVAYKFKSLEDVKNEKSQDDEGYDIIGRMTSCGKEKSFKDNYGEKIKLVGPGGASIDVVVWNEYRDSIPSIGDVVAVRYGKLYKGSPDRQMSVNTNSFIQKIETQDQLPPSERQFYNELLEKETRKRKHSGGLR